MDNLNNPDVNITSDNKSEEIADFERKVKITSKLAELKEAREEILRQKTEAEQEQEYLKKQINDFAKACHVNYEYEVQSPDVNLLTAEDMQRAAEKDFMAKLYKAAGLNPWEYM